MASIIVSLSQLYLKNNPPKVIIGKDLDFLQNDESLSDIFEVPIAL